jgi:hypothetical protein
MLSLRYFTELRHVGPIVRHKDIVRGRQAVSLTTWFFPTYYVITILMVLYLDRRNKQPWVIYAKIQRWQVSHNTVEIEGHRLYKVIAVSAIDQVKAVRRIWVDSQLIFLPDSFHDRSSEYQTIFRMVLVQYIHPLNSRS